MISVDNSLEIMFIEPFYGGSHKQLIDTLIKYFPNSKLVSLTAKKWPWRARCGALVLSEIVPKVENERILFCSSVLSLAELLGIRPDLQPLKKIVYFHENQLVYPIQDIKARDVQYAYNQITTCLAADIVLFNSHFNKTSFLSNIKKIIKLIPDFRPKKIQELIEPKCQVVYFPIDFSSIPLTNPSNSEKEEKEILHIIWPHRWEFDKDPNTFFETLFKLKKEGFSFKLSVLGEQFSEIPPIFNQAKEELKENIIQFGYAESKEKYYEILNKGHVVISTANHEFFGVAMLEAVHCGCFPLAPNRLVYPELYPNECLYKNPEELLTKLKEFSNNPGKIKIKYTELKLQTNKYSTEKIIPDLIKILNE